MDYTQQISNTRMNKHRFIDVFPRVFHEKFYVSANFQSIKQSAV